MAEIHEYVHTVRPAEIDPLGHANNVAYVAWLQAAAVAHSAALGWPPERYREFGTGWIVRSHAIEYLQPAYVGEEIVVRTWVATMKKASSLRRYQVVRAADSCRLAVAETRWVCINYATGQAVRIPPEIASAFPLVEEEAAEHPARRP